MLWLLLELPKAFALVALSYQPIQEWFSPTQQGRWAAASHRLRDAHGRYWTGWVFGQGPTDNQYWPVEHTTYTAAAMILAVDALGAKFGQCTAASGIMRAEEFAVLLGEFALECGCQSFDAVTGLS